MARPPILVGKESLGGTKMTDFALIVDNSARADQNEDTECIALAIQGMTVSYGAEPAIYSIDMNVGSSTLTAIIGPNGAGKSTLLKASMGIIPIVSGRVHFFGKPLSKTRHRISYVPQRASVDWDFPATVKDVVLMGLYPTLGFLKWVDKEQLKLVRVCLSKVGMQDLSHRQIGQLSSGQQQRVFLARALVQNADVYLLDEPFAGVDAATEKAIISVLKDLKSMGKTVLVVHHDLTTVEDYFDQVFLINKSAIAHGPTAKIFTDQNLSLAYGRRLDSAKSGVAQS